MFRSSPYRNHDGLILEGMVALVSRRERSPGEGLDEVDVLVIGYGAAGAAAVLAAHDAGARVSVVEKCPQPGGNSLVSSATPSTRSTRMTWSASPGI